MRNLFVLVTAGAFLSGACSESGSRPPCTPVQMARAEVWGGQIAVDETFVYWTERTGGRVMRAERPDGAPALLDELGPATQFELGMAAGGGRVHWTAQQDGAQAVFVTAADGLTTRALLGCFNLLVGDGTGTAFGLGCNDSIIAVFAPNAPPTTFSTGGFGFGIVAGVGTVQTSINQVLMSFTSTGLATTLIPSTFGFPVARHAQTVFVAEGDRLLSVPANGGPTTPIATLPNTIDVGGGAADETHVYVRVVAGGGAEHDLFAVPRSGGEPRFLATVRPPSSLAVAPEGVYWSTNGAPPEGGVFRLDRCAYD